MKHKRKLHKSWYTKRKKARKLIAAANKLVEKIFV
jgi:hypothetical protein